MSVIAEVTPIEAASRLMRKAGLTDSPHALTRLPGGRNNRVFRIERDGPPLVIKCYHHDPRDPRDRLGAEWAFLHYAWHTCGLRTVPAPLAADPASHTALYAFVPGARIAAVEPRHVEAAARFIAALNTRVARSAAEALPPASEACFSLAAHLEAIARRVARLEARLDPSAPYFETAAALVRSRLVPAWRRFVRNLTPDSTPLPWCISPSDFGFHNALEADGRLTFLDFEYAGRDDPAKLICDFFCQPDLPAPPSLYPAFRDAVLGALGLGTITHSARCDALLPAYGIKWVCIMLNEFIVADAARRHFAEGADRASRCAAQLAKAAAALDRLQTT
ncbi:phosphotransferase [Elioraea tepida]|uniref:Phosphotransferase n=1 Tax=Elioraea tepida TaxID=2843330 RepID=A0A975YK16_9PROT|nr:phosphotransferase [Elioraea tepida]QXM24997.1 phosphotransferase [Elioraea tepida]